jgi:hypothetical protein
MTDTTPRTAEPEIVVRDLVRTPYVFAEHQGYCGVVVDIVRQPHVTHGDRYLVHYPGGVTEWHWRDELIVQPFTQQRQAVLVDLDAARMALHSAAITAEGYDLLVQQLGGLLDALNGLSTTYLGQELTDHTAVAAPHTHP